MPAESHTQVAEPDYGFVNPPPLGQRMPDFGPRYTETPPDPYGPNAPLPAEPYNTATAALFVAIVVVWAWRLKGRYGRFPFLSACLGVLLVGGVGGTLYHALRTSRAFFLMDVVPISLLGVAGAVYLAVKLWHRNGWWYLLGALAGYGAFTALLFRVIEPLPFVRRLGGDPHTLAVNANYAALAVVVIVPLFVTLLRTRFRDVGWVAVGLVSFAVAWFFRLVDVRAGVYLPMGSHWLWHTFGAVSTAALIEYFYRVERGPGES